MADDTILGRVRRLPPPYDAERLERGMAALAEAARDAADSAAGDAARLLLEDEAGRGLLAAVFGNSPYLARILLREISFLPRLVGEAPEAVMTALLDDTRAAAADGGQKAVMAGLRQAKRRVALLVALADIAGAWPLETVTAGLSDFADAAVRAALRWLLREAVARGDLAPADEQAPEQGLGLVLIGMGKYGSRELNYSSDIDFMVFFDAEAVPYIGSQTAQACFVRMTQALVKLLQETTVDGYVFRADLRLRPDPAATPVAISMAAAEQYYESMGQNWERAAMIKARAVAGDLAAGEGLLRDLQPFIWRRNLDFAAIEDVHSIKRQIHSHKGHGAVAVAGHNIKLGRGGIRDIEFFVQTQQLIAGGRDRGLRQSTTAGAMAALAGAGWITAEAADELMSAYRFHRTLEHRLQMIADEQTHTLPKTEAGLDHVARFMGYAESDRFREDLLGHLRRVQKHYAALFEKSAPLAEEQGNLVFTGTDDDPDTLETLRRMGFDKPAGVSATIRGWHHGRYSAMRSARARELLTQLVPALLKAVAGTASPDATFGRFDRFLAGLPTGVQLFSLLFAHPGLLDLLAEVMGSAPRLANYLSRNAGVLDAVLDPEFFAALPPAAELEASLRIALGRDPDFQDVLDRSRRWLKERKFQLGLQLVGNFTRAETAAGAYTDLAEAVLRTLTPAVAAEFARIHGQVPGSRMVVVAMGKLGSRELTETSDLDLIFIYDVSGEEPQSDGARPLPATQYFARLGQRLVNALTAMTGEGKLYEVDMRLRPSGHAGPLAVRLGTFAEYQQEQAWTWEHMALTRARVVAGPDDLAAAVTEAVGGVVRRRRDPAATARDVAEMRARIGREKGTRDPWDLKRVRGGLIDLEFICQYLQLVHAAAHPDVHRQNTAEAFAALAAAGVLAPEAAGRLLAATTLYRNLSGLLRVAVEEGTFRPDTAPEGLKRALAKAADAPDFAALEARLVETEADVLREFEAIVERAAG